MARPRRACPASFCAWAGSELGVFRDDIAFETVAECPEREMTIYRQIGALAGVVAVEAPGRILHQGDGPTGQRVGRITEGGRLGALPGGGEPHRRRGQYGSAGDLSPLRACGVDAWSHPALGVEVVQHAVNVGPVGGDIG